MGWWTWFDWWVEKLEEHNRSWFWKQRENLNFEISSAIHQLCICERIANEWNPHSLSTCSEWKQCDDHGPTSQTQLVQLTNSTVHWLHQKDCTFHLETYSSLHHCVTNCLSRSFLARSSFIHHPRFQLPHFRESINWQSSLPSIDPSIYYTTTN